MDLDGRRAVITGASAGIGAACARRLAALGAECLLVARRADRLEALAEELRAAGGRAQAQVLDLSDPPAIGPAARAIEAGGPVDLLINNAGLALGRAPVTDGDPAHWRTMFETNVIGLLAFTRALLPGMVRRGQGHLVNIGSIAGRQTYPGGAVYCATKAALRALTEGLRLDLLGRGVRVSTVDPGLVESEFSLVRHGGDAAQAGAVYAGMTPLTPDDVADVVAFIVTRPAHVNVAETLLLPADQASALHVHRRC